MAFDAFMSYSHAADGRLAPALQQGLHKLGKPWYRKRALRVFRDKTSLSANPALWPSIERALAESSHFILLASPAAAKSHWVTSEVAWWLSNRQPDKLLIVLTDGELRWDSTKQDFDWDVTDAIPRALAGRFAAEPLYVDLRWARTVDDLSLRHSQFRGAVLDLAAPLHGIPKDELDGEDVRQYRRMRQVRFVAISALVAFAAIAVWQAVVARMQANRAVAQRLAAQAELSRRGEAYSCLDRAALLAVTSLSMTPLLETSRLMQELLQVLPIASLRSPNGGQHSVISPTGRHVVIQNNDGLTRIHDLERGEELKTLEHKARRGLVRFDQGGTTLMSVIDAEGSPSRVRTIDLASLAVVDHPPIAGNVTAVATRVDRTVLAATTSQGTASVLDAHTGMVIASVAESYRGSGTRFSPSGKHVAIGFGDILARVGVLHIVDTMTGAAQTLRFDLPIAALTFSADDKYLALTEQFVWGSRAANAHLVDVATGRILRTMPVPPGTGLIEFSPDGELLALAGQVGIDIIHVADGSRLSRPAVDNISTAVFTPDSKAVVVGTSSTGLPRIAQSVGDQEELTLREDSCDLGRLRIFDANSGIERVPLDRKAHTNQVVFSPDGQRLVAGGYRGQGATTIDVFDYSDAGSHVPLRAFRELAARSRITDFVAETTADATYLVTVGGRRVLAVFEIATGTQVATDMSIDGPVALSPDGHHLALTTAEGVQSRGEQDQSVVVRVFELATMKRSRDDIVFSEPPLAIKIDNHARRLLFVDGDAKLRVVDLATRAQFASASDMDSVVAFAFSPDGALVAIPGAQGEVVDLRDVDGKVSASLKHAQAVSVIEFSPDGSHLATAEGSESFGVGGRGKVNVFDLSTRKIVLEVPYEGGTPALSFSSDGTMVIVRLATGVIRVFRLADGAEATRFAVPGGAASLAVADGNRQILIVANAMDGKEPQLYSRVLQPGDLIAAACSRLTRNLTWDEWAQYFGDAPYQRSCPNLPCPSGGQSRGSNRCVRE